MRFAEAKIHLFLKRSMFPSDFGKCPGSKPGFWEGGGGCIYIYIYIYHIYIYHVYTYIYICIPYIYVCIPLQDGWFAVTHQRISQYRKRAVPVICVFSGTLARDCGRANGETLGHSREIFRRAGRAGWRGGEGNYVHCRR